MTAKEELEQLAADIRRGEGGGVGVPSFASYVASSAIEAAKQQKQQTAASHSGSGRQSGDAGGVGKPAPLKKKKAMKQLTLVQMGS